MGQLLGFRRDPIGFLTTMARSYGDLAYFTLGNQKTFLLNHPDYINRVLVVSHRNFVKARGMERAKGLLGDGLLTSEGEFHHRQRRLVQPAFHPERITSFGPVMAECAERAQEHWRDGATLDMAQEMMRLTLTVVGKTLLNADLESDLNKIGEALSTSIDFFFAIRWPFLTQFDKVFSSREGRFLQARDRLDAIIYRIIREHRAGGHQSDLLSMLLGAEDVDGDGGRMTDVRARDEVITLILAGHETTANALTWTWYLLSQHPEVEARLHAELDAVLKGRLPGADDFPRLRYTRMIFAESLRLFPPVWVIGRRALSSCVVGAYELPAGAILLMSPYVMHRDPRYFSDPFVFDPERWAPESHASRPKLAYFPFGAGPRQCVGEGFAWMEGVLLLATLGRRWQMRLVRGHPVKLQPLVTLRPKYGMRMTLRERNTKR